MSPEIERFVTGLGNTILWSAVAILIVIGVFEALERKYKLMQEIFHENSTAAAILAGSFVLGIFYAVTQIVIH
ncbi:MAG TPA: DUF350 domain-containing protein [Dehalococcoidia bacterium]|nr:DUF350 domain-containing protein [Dehalococcoidia bacterium]HLE79990.1 DUF350 domain-containing protein [Dehalococcoidia bacterium]